MFEFHNLNRSFIDIKFTNIFGPLLLGKNIVTIERSKINKIRMRLKLFRKIGTHPYLSIKYVKVFLSLPGSYLEAEVTDKRVNLGRAYGLGVPCKHCLTGQEKAIDWITKEITSILYEHTAAVNKCLGKK